MDPCITLFLTTINDEKYFIFDTTSMIKYMVQQCEHSFFYNDDDAVHIAFEVNVVPPPINFKDLILCSEWTVRSGQQQS